MKVSELGEFGLIDLLGKMVAETRDGRQASWQRLLVGIGDDAAAWQAEPVQLATVDALVQDIHFSLDICSWDELGWKAIAVNLSDIAAMGGQPRYALVSLALPGHIEVENIAALYRGMIQICTRFGVAIIGGNISGAPQIGIHVTVLGSQSEPGNLLRRSGAAQGNQIAVTGYPGNAAAGWQMLSGKLKFDSATTEQLKKAFLLPCPRISEGQALVKEGIRTAIDISDGLLSDLNHICQASNVGAQVDIDKIPVSAAVKANFGEKALDLALSGGEDYELLFTGKTEAIERVRKSVSCPVTVIGEIVARVGEDRINLVDGKGNKVKARRKGWEHFKY